MTAKPKGKDLGAFREAHDRSFVVPKRIKEALAELGESWEYEAEFIRRCSVSTGEFARYREPFIDHCVETARTNGQSHAKRVWAGTKAFAARLREAIR